MNYIRNMACYQKPENTGGITNAIFLLMITRRIILLECSYRLYPFLYVVAPAALDWRMPMHVRNDYTRWDSMGDEPEYLAVYWTQYLTSHIYRTRKSMKSASEKYIMRGFFVPSSSDIERDTCYNNRGLIGKFIYFSLSASWEHMLNHLRWTSQLTEI